MMKAKFVLPLVVSVLATVEALAQSPTVPVTVDNFARAETDLYMAKTVKDAGLGKFLHIRAPTGIDR